MRLDLIHGVVAASQREGQMRVCREATGANGVKEYYGGGWCLVWPNANLVCISVRP